MTKPMQPPSQLLPTGRPRIEHMEMRKIVKRFPGVLACDHVNFDVRAGARQLAWRTSPKNGCTMV